MANISVNTDVTEQIFNSSTQLIESIRGELARLNNLIMDLPVGGEWKGVAADKFMGDYMEMQSKITVDFPDLLTALATNLQTNRQNLIDADAAGA